MQLSTGKKYTTSLCFSWEIYVLSWKSDGVTRRRMSLSWRCVDGEPGWWPGHLRDQQADAQQADLALLPSHWSQKVATSFFTSLLAFLNLTKRLLFLNCFYFIFSLAVLWRIRIRISIRSWKLYFLNFEKGTSMRYSALGFLCHTNLYGWVNFTTKSKNLGLKNWKFAILYF
jgi:hypothetical protein